MRRFPRLLAILLAVATAAAAASCRKGKGKSGRRAPVESSLPQPDPAPENPPAPPAPPAPPSHPDVGVDEPPITDDNVTTIDTTKGARLSHLIFETSATQEAGRYLSEYILVVRAREESCIRLKTRPTGGLTQEVDDKVLNDAEKGSGACAGQKLGGEGGAKQKNEDEEKEKEKADEKAPAALRLAAAAAAAAPSLSFPEDGKLPAARAFGLTGAGVVGKTKRLFRMEAEGLETIVSKNGCLLHQNATQRVRIWVDAEFTNVCDGGPALDARAPVPYGPLIQNARGFNPATADKLWTSQLATLASEMDKILGRLTKTYGPLSDIDSSGYVEIFLSPDVNRQYFVTYPTFSRDTFRAKLVFRPQDLAFYNPESNPTSNEGEILYLWTPDPAGIYNMKQYPSANSITSNYAKGYLTAQAMTLLFANQRLFVQKQKSFEERWLVEPISLLAASYYAGNDYPVLPLGQYLTSRPQYVPLTADVSQDLVGAPYLAMAGDELTGMRALFGWYLHNRLCGKTVQPCSPLIALINSKKTGRDNLAELLGEPLEKTLENFGLSVAVELLDNPGRARGLWQRTPPLPGLPPAPVEMSALTEIFADDPPLTAEASYTGTLLGGSAVDRTVAGPFPSKDGMLFQVLTADNDMEFKLAKDSISIILVTGLIESRTDVTALFGKGLNVVFVPTGERDVDRRRIHIEKISELAHSDLRPENLTTLMDANHTYSAAPVYDGIDYGVTATRDLWILGSIDNFEVNVGGALTATGDTDAFVVDVRPCDGTTQAQAACEAANHQVLVQVMVRDFDKELAPMVMVTDTDRGIFRGFGVYGRLKDLIPDIEEEKPTYLCKAQIAAQSEPVTFLAGTPGIVVLPLHGFDGVDDFVQFSAGAVSLPAPLVSRIDYEVVYIDANRFSLLDTSGNPVAIPAVTADEHNLHTGRRDACSNGGIAGAFIYDHETTKVDATGWAHTYDNFLSMGPLGYPFSTQHSISYKDMPPCGGYRCFQAFEWRHSHFVFKLSESLEPEVYPFVAVPSVPKDGSVLAEAEIYGLYSIKRRIDECATYPDDQPETFVNECMGVPTMTEIDCRLLCTNAAVINARHQTRLNLSKAFVVCPYGYDCTAAEYLIRPGTNTTAWVNPARYFWYQPTTHLHTSFYRPIEPTSRDSYCGGEPGYSQSALGTCGMRHDAITHPTDIRQQLHVKTDQFAYGPYECRSRVLGPSGHRVCFDGTSVDREYYPQDTYSFLFAGRRLPTDRARVGYPSWTDPRSNSTFRAERTPFDIAIRAGEVIEKPERLQATILSIPGTGKPITIIIGGRGESQGKYLLRVQVREFD